MPSPDLIIHSNQPPRLVPRDGVLLREDTAFTDARGKDSKHPRKLANQALEKLKDILPKVLEKDEAVLYVARAQAPVSSVEQFTFGYYAYSITASLLVFTNRRLLDFHLKVGSFGRWEWGRSLRSLHWGDVEQARVKGWLSRMLELKYRNGKKERYWRLKGRDARKVKLLLEALLPGSAAEGTAAQAAVPLCPDCLAPLTANVYQCSQCRLPFKNERELIWRSLAFPGGGYFYAGYWWLGVLDAIVESILTGWLLIFLLVAAGMPEPFRSPLEPHLGRAGALGAAGVVAILLGLEKLITVYHGKRFLQVFIPASAGSSHAGGTIFGVVAYALIGLVVWAVIPPRQTLLQVAPNLTIESAQFGTFSEMREGGLSFSPTSIVPNRNGQQYGWVVNLRTARNTVHVREEHIVWTVTVEGENGQAVPLTLANEADVGTEGGVIYGTWAVENEEPTGSRTMKVYIDGTLVETFSFTIP
ncbi:MAG: hypothetical protein HYY26_01860 [Acidobacteria bacterium]|nr:hypothetical protein [Acidobacteriota bacterium]